MTSNELGTGRPVAVLKVEAVDQHSQKPETTDENGQSDGDWRSGYEISVESKSQHGEGDNTQDDEESVGPHQLLVERGEAGQFFPPLQAGRNLEAGDED